MEMTRIIMGLRGENNPEKIARHLAQTNLESQ